MQDGRPEWSLPAGGLVCYDWKRKKAHHLNGNRVPLQIAAFDDEFHLLCPIVHGWALIGRSDKYLSPSGVEHVAYSNHQLRLELIESGPILVWHESKTPVIAGTPLAAVSPHLWFLDLPVKPGRQSLEISLQG